MTINYRNPDYTAIWANRKKRLERIRKNAKWRRSAQSYYQGHPVQFIDDWLITYDPRRKAGATMPFITFKRQKEYIEWLRGKWAKEEDGLVEKSRDMGVTYLNIAFAVWLWLFHPGSKIGFGSRKEQLVDRLGDPDSIFEKIRVILRNLPKQFLPAGYDEDKHALYLKIVNPANGNSITGEAGDNIGRGGRNTIYFKDESAFYDRPDRIEAALSMNTDIQIDVSTPNGLGNPFYRKRMSGAVDVFVFDWREDPRKDQEWYDAQVEKYAHSPFIVAQEIDRNYSASVEMVAIPGKWIEAAVNYNLPDTGTKVLALDPADEGIDMHGVVWRKGIVVKFVEEWKEGDTGDATRRCWRICQDEKIPTFKFDSIGIGAGVKTTARSLLANQAPNQSKRAFVNVQGVNVGKDPTSGNWEEGKTNKDMFRNLKAQLWFEMRRRFYNTYRRRNGDLKVQADKCISIPNHAQLKMELGQPKYEIAENGLIQIESKKKMAARGLRSPNLADALVICFARATGLDYSMLTQE